MDPLTRRRPGRTEVEVTHLASVAPPVGPDGPGHDDFGMNGST
jgi:hypothetical protein